MPSPIPSDPPRSIGLLPLFNEASGYLKDKISSSAVVSLATATPLLVPRTFLDTYSYIKPEHVLLMVGTEGGDGGEGGGRVAKGHLMGM